jgi:hypothetical protein
MSVQASSLSGKRKMAFLPLSIPVTQPSTTVHYNCYPALPTQKKPKKRPRERGRDATSYNSSKITVTQQYLPNRKPKKPQEKRGETQPSTTV